MRPTCCDGERGRGARGPVVPIHRASQSCSDVLLHCMCVQCGARGMLGGGESRGGREGGREGGRYSLTLRRGVDGLRVSIYVYVWTYPAWVCVGSHGEQLSTRVGGRSLVGPDNWVGHSLHMDGRPVCLSFFLFFFAAIHPSFSSSYLSKCPNSIDKAGAEGLVPTPLPFWLAHIYYRVHSLLFNPRALPPLPF